MFSSNTSQVSSGGYEIQRSLRFNSADSAYLIRTPASAGNRRTWTWSAWVKRSELGTRQQIFNARPGGSEVIEFQTDNTIQMFDFTGGFIYQMSTVAVYRDPSAWYHIVWTKDTTQATDTNRMKLYVNGVQIFFSTATYPALNSESYINNNVAHHLGTTETTALFLGGYMTEVNFIDGQALTPSSFGAFDAQTGVWGPTRYAGSYGTNGFYLNFSDNSNTTAATLGRDYSGNSNNWTPNNFSVSAGAGNDSLVDVPTNWGTDTGVGGTVRGNYCTLNPLYGNPAPTNGNLDISVSTQTGYGSMSFTSGKWYWEVTPTALLSGAYLGVMDSTYIKTDSAWSTATAAAYVSDGSKYGMGGSGAYGASYTNNDVIGFALDLDAGTMVFYKNGTSQGTAFTGMTGREWRPMVYGAAGTYVCNFGQRPFAYTAPSGFRALNTQNLPTPTIGATTATQAGKFFNPVLYTGNGTTNSITGVGFQPDFVWMKNRASGFFHGLYDVVRGTGTSKSLYSNTTEAEGTNSANQNLVSFDSNGFTLGSTSSTNAINTNGEAHVSWNWKANGAGVTNTAGTVTSTVSANTTSKFSVVTWTGTGVNATFGHGLGVAPAMVIMKNRTQGSVGYNWAVYHRSLPDASYFLDLNTANAQAINAGIWNSVAPTATVVTVGTARINNGDLNVAYCFAEVPGYSRFGSYTGNGSADAPFVFCGFRPAYVMIKGTSAGAANTFWIVFDSKRNTFNLTNSCLATNNADAEFSIDSVVSIDLLSNGFKVRSSNPEFGINQPNNFYVFAAFAEAPQKFALAR